MDGTRFDTLTRSLTGSRRGIVGGLVAGALGLLGVIPPDGADAAGACKPKCGECRTCKKGKCRQTPRGKVCKKGKCQPKRNGTACSRGICKAGRCVGPTCSDGIKNGSETGVDCGGGTCPPCAIGNTCSVRGDCASALCVGGACRQCVQATDCGFEADGVTPCFCIENSANERVCTNQPGRFVGGGTCANCSATEQCQPLMNGVQCYQPCGFVA